MLCWLPGQAQFLRWPLLQELFCQAQHRCSSHLALLALPDRVLGPTLHTWCCGQGRDAVSGGEDPLVITLPGWAKAQTCPCVSACPEPTRALLVLLVSLCPCPGAAGHLVLVFPLLAQPGVTLAFCLTRGVLCPALPLQQVSVQRRCGGSGCLGLLPAHSGVCPAGWRGCARSHCLSPTLCGCVPEPPGFQQPSAAGAVLPHVGALCLCHAWGGRLCLVMRPGAAPLLQSRLWPAQPHPGQRPAPAVRCHGEVCFGLVCFFVS